MIPGIIHQTWRTKDEREWPRGAPRWVSSWRGLRGWRHVLHDDDDCLDLVRAHAPEHVAIFAGLRPVEKADLWRYLVVHRLGGLYTDLDTRRRHPLERWLDRNDGLVLGLMTDLLDEYPDWQPRQFVRSGGGFDPTQRWQDHPVMFTNWTFAGQAGHPVLGEVVRRVVVNATDPYFTRENPEWTVKKTGPGVLTDVVNDYLSAHGTSAEAVARKLRRVRSLQVGDVRLLGYAAFHTRHVVHYGMRCWGPPRHGLDRLWNRIRARLG